MSLKEWRLKQTKKLCDLLPTYLTIFREILYKLKKIHNLNTTHYDLKCDNIVLNEDFSIRICDFGECRIFLNEIDEHCLRSKGTDVIKSPEMLIQGQIRKDDDNFDRRKKMGTTRSSDIWSLGCLFYELLTGEFLFIELQENFSFAYVIQKENIDNLLTKESCYQSFPSRSVRIRLAAWAVSSE